MKVIDLFTVKGRGRLAIIDAMPEGLTEGMHLRQGDHRWCVTGIETYVHYPRERYVDQSVGVLIKPVGDSPIDPKIGERFVRDVI